MVERQDQTFLYSITEGQKRDVAVIREAALASAEQHQYLTFQLGDEMFAIGILSIREIIEYGFITEVPMTPPFIRGVINLRGAVVPVLDLAVRFGRKARESTKRTCIIIVDIETDKGSHEIGLVIDAAKINPSPLFHGRTSY